MAQTETTEAPKVGRKASDVAAWVAAKRHAIVLPSGISVEIEIPNLPLMIKTGEIPNDLVSSAMSAIQRDTITPELLSQQSDFYHKLVATTVKAPSITEDDVATLPYEDVELIVEIATRQRDLDAIGRHISGLHKSSEWRTFRGLDYGDSSLEDM